MTDTLDGLLGQIYSLQVVQSSDSSAPRAALMAALKDEDFRQQAITKLSALNQIPDKRCFVSSVYKQYLKEALYGQAQ